MGMINQQAIDLLSNTYFPCGSDSGEAIAKAIEALKAQEAVEPIIDIRHGKSMWRCGSCSTALQPNQMHAKFCFNCGRTVKWG